MNWNDIVQSILGVGSTVLIPIFIAILGLIFGMKPSKALLSGLYLGTGFIGMSLAINQLTAAVSPAAKALAKTQELTCQLLTLAGQELQQSLGPGRLHLYFLQLNLESI